MAAILQNPFALDTPAAPRPNLRLVRSDLQDHDATASAPGTAGSTAVMAYLSPGKHGNDRMLHKAMSAALEAGGDFYAVYVDEPRIIGGVRHARTLIDDFVLAGALGAKIVWLESSDPTAALLNFARKSRVSRIFVTRSEPSLFQRAVYRELLSRGQGVRIDIVGFERGRHPEAERIDSAR